jgi:raffinose/stachyose/melibiose transport system permease protein
MIIGTLQGFGLQLLLLGDSGGPAGAGMVPGLWMYNRAFSAGEFGYACAIGLILFIFILALTWVNNKFVRVEK